MLIIHLDGEFVNHTEKMGVHFPAMIFHSRKTKTTIKYFMRKRKIFFKKLLTFIYFYDIILKRDL